MGEFDQLPFEAARTLCSSATPLIKGGARFAGGGGGGAGTGATTGVALLVAEAEPPAFDAVTTTRSVFPTSAEARAYCEEAAPEIEAQLAPAESQRRHW